MKYRLVVECSALCRFSLIFDDLAELDSYIKTTYARLENNDAYYKPLLRIEIVEAEAE